LRKKPIAEQTAFLHGLLEQNVRAIVEFEEEVKVIVVSEASLRLAFEVHVLSTDMGLVLGGGGATADAIRRIVWTACKKTDWKRVDIEFVGA
jgi:predicted RNA-binding protein YlqC (UPF0109 family)